MIAARKTVCTVRYWRALSAEGAIDAVELFFAPAKGWRDLY
jgi:hypothetical protein